ncbi:leucine-rich repeat-containing protein 72 [Pelodytes ibericus]
MSAMNVLNLEQSVIFLCLLIQIIEEQLKKCGYKTDSDVTELYLGRKGLKEITDLSRFRMLNYVWLNHNKISKITGLSNICRLSELYLNNNELCKVTGSMKHLTSLRILMLNDNLLTNLEDTVKELKGMRSLHTLNLFHNPLSQDTDYRLYVIYHLPSVQLLDRESVTHKEREDAFQLFNPERSAVMQSLGFGRRTDYVLPRKRPLVHGRLSRHAPMSLRSCCTAKDNRQKVLGFEDAVSLKAYQRSIMELYLVNWNTIPSSKEKRIEDSAQLITVQFR